MTNANEQPIQPIGGGLSKHLGEALDRFSETGPYVFFGRSSAPRISMSYLKQWLHRVGSGLRAGVDIRTLLKQESNHGPSSYRVVFAEFLRRVSRGDSFGDAARDAGDFFPPMVVEMIHVGEFTGKLDEVLLRLADHYDHMLSLRRMFMIGIAWPVAQLFLGIIVVGLMIWLVGALANPMGGEPPDYFGFGTGSRGLFNYACFVLSIVTVVGGMIIAVRRGWLGATGWRLALKIPLLGKCIETMALARMTWTLSLTLEAGADARKSLRMALRSSQLPLYTDVIERADAEILKGVEFHVAMQKMEVFPDEFLHAMETAEISGQLSESMIRLSRDYSDRAAMASKLLTGVATFIVYGGVAMLLIYVIIRMFMSYVKMIESFL